MRPFLLPLLLIAGLGACDGENSFRITASTSDDGAGKGVLRVIDALQCPDAVGVLTRKGLAANGGASCVYGGPKGAEGGRVETHWPLDAGADAGVEDAGESAVSDSDDLVPGVVLAAIAQFAPDAGPLTPIARIVNRRDAFALRDASGGVVAEFVDDHVVALDETRGVETSWREWEFELGEAAPTTASARAALFHEAAAAVARVGGRPAASDSKLARTLGL